MIIPESCSCILTDTLKVISKKWNAFVFCQLLEHEAMYFNELYEELSDGCGKKITPSVLSQILKELEEYNLVSKKILAEYIPVRTEYQITTKGKELCIIYSIIRQWARKWSIEEKTEDKKKFSCNVFDVLEEVQSKVNIVFDLSILVDSN